MTLLVAKNRLRGKNPRTMSQNASAIADRRRRHRTLPGYPIPSYNMTKVQQDDYFAGDSIVCLMCGKGYRVINDTHLLRVHNMTQDEYRERYGLPYTKCLSCGELRKIRSIQGQHKIKNLKPMTRENAKKRKKARVSASARQARRENMMVAMKFVDEEARNERVKKPRCLNMAQIKEILESKETGLSLAKFYNVSDGTISRIRANRYSYTNELFAQNICEEQ